MGPPPTHRSSTPKRCGSKSTPRFAGDRILIVHWPLCRRARNPGFRSRLAGPPDRSRRGHVDFVVAYERGARSCRRMIWPSPARHPTTDPCGCSAAPKPSPIWFEALPQHHWHRPRTGHPPRIAQAAHDAGFGEVRECRPAPADVVASMNRAHELCATQRSSTAPCCRHCTAPAEAVIAPAAALGAPRAMGITHLLLGVVAAAALASSVMLCKKLTGIQEQLARQSADWGRWRLRRAPSPDRRKIKSEKRLPGFRWRPA